MRGDCCIIGTSSIYLCFEVTLAWGVYFDQYANTAKTFCGRWAETASARGNHSVYGWHRDPECNKPQIRIKCEVREGFTYIEGRYICAAGMVSPVVT